MTAFLPKQARGTPRASLSKREPNTAPYEKEGIAVGHDYVQIPALSNPPASALSTGLRRDGCC